MSKINSCWRVVCSIIYCVTCLVSFMKSLVNTHPIWICTSVFLSSLGFFLFTRWLTVQLVAVHFWQSNPCCLSFPPSVRYKSLFLLLWHKWWCDLVAKQHARFSRSNPSNRKLHLRQCAREHHAIFCRRCFCSLAQGSCAIFVYLFLFKFFTWFLFSFVFNLQTFYWCILIMWFRSLFRPYFVLKLTPPIFAT